MQYDNNNITSEKEQELLNLADNMASAATTFNMHGYEIFLQARDRFIETLHETLNLLNQIT